ncbi:MAG: glucose-6-phosphate isomerase [Spirochaetia bacterium]
MKFQNLDQCKAYREMAEKRQFIDLSAVLTPKRIKEYSIPLASGLRYNYSAKQADESIIRDLESLAEEQQVLEKFQMVLDGKIMNPGEQRKVLHHLQRIQLGEPVVSEGKNLKTFYDEQHERVKIFSETVHSGSVTGSTGKKFDTAVQIGIGGSDLGPRALHIALEGYFKREEGAPFMRGLFISNVDPDDAARTLKQIDPETTLFIVVSKSGTTQETLTNEAFAVKFMESKGIPGLKPKKHIVTVTSETSPLAKSKEYLDSFFIDDYIGGRYSATSPVGGVILSLCYGNGIFRRILKGAADADRSALEKDIRKNGALMDALLGVYERNILGYPVTAVLPYSQALLRFPAHLQQLDMESNGKSVNRSGEPVQYSTGPVVFGEPGTNGQHSFYQLLHQGTDIVPLQFIGFLKSQEGYDLDYLGSTSQMKLNSNLAAQIVAFAKGKDDSDPNKTFKGNRPSSLIHGPELTPEALGAILAHFENKVAFQGLIWNVNSFDQEGVQLGKKLSRQILSWRESKKTGVKEQDIDPVLAEYARLLNLE